MDWIDRANRLLAEHRERERFLSEHECEIYEQFWDELKRHVEAAKATFPGLSTNGQPYERIIALPPAPSAVISVPQMLTVSLDRESHQITASAGPQPFGHSMAETFQIAVKGDGVACLRREEREMSYKAAATRVLWQFLYPELPYKPEPGLVL